MSVLIYLKCISRLEQARAFAFELRFRMGIRRREQNFVFDFIFLHEI